MVVVAMGEQREGGVMMALGGREGSGSVLGHADRCDSGAGCGAGNGEGLTQGRDGRRMKRMEVSAVSERRRCGAGRERQKIGRVACSSYCCQGEVVVVVVSRSSCGLS